MALVSLKAEDVLAREKQSETEQRAIIITHAPSVPKLTRAKARELNKTPVISLPLLNAETQQPEIAKLIQDELNSDEEDEDFTLQEEELPVIFVTFLEITVLHILLFAFSLTMGMTPLALGMWNLTLKLRYHRP